MNTIWTIIGIIVLVSIITGTTLHDAFWGIFSFSMSLTVFFTIFFIIREVFVSIKGGFNSSKEVKKEQPHLKKQQNVPLTREQQRLLDEQNKKRRKEAMKDDWASSILFLALFSPLLIATVLALVCKEFTMDHPGLTFLISASPFFTGLLCLFTYGTKGQTPIQKLKSFGRFSWGIIKLFLIVLAIMLGIGLIILLLNSFHILS